MRVQSMYFSSRKHSSTEVEKNLPMLHAVIATAIFFATAATMHRHVCSWLRLDPYQIMHARTNTTIFTIHADG